MIVFLDSMDQKLTLKGQEYLSEAVPLGYSMIIMKTLILQPKVPLLLSN